MGSMPILKTFAMAKPKKQKSAGLAAQEKTADHPVDRLIPTNQMNDADAARRPNRYEDEGSRKRPAVPPAKRPTGMDA